MTFSTSSPEFSGHDFFSKCQKFSMIMLVENIVPKPQSAMTVGHCPIQLGVWKILHFEIPKIGKKTVTFSHILDTNSKKNSHNLSTDW